MKKNKIYTNSRCEPHHLTRTKNTKHHLSLAFYLPLIAISVLILATGCLYVYGKFYYSRDSQLKEMAKQITSKNPEEIAQVAVDSNKRPLPVEELKPLSELYLSSDKERLVMKEKVEHATNSGNVQVIEVGKILGLYPRYRVLLKPIPMTVKTNLKNVTVFVNGDTIEYFGNQGKIVQNRLPGKYTINCVGLAGGTKQKLSKTLLLSPVPEKNLISFNVTTKPKNPLKNRNLVDLEPSENIKDEKEPAHESNSLIEQVKEWFKNPI
ncbi:hypothetical protein [Xylocopilactobacillus apicola]|uniref:Uncharacterized protein n=1 Tax=Xylocopilactobacillus apicola TaxID=2932184 RepID=A0AAU9D8H8_9LACO|nr:hypothetical protein [Xylocopilactobacillus apicola]BDR58691.1 hypothetical protein XA3_11320 [Xylocopilactobacillus apicola]